MRRFALVSVAFAVFVGAGGELRASAAKPPVRTFDIVASGDVLIYPPIWLRALIYGDGRYDFRPMFREIRPVVRRAALALCHVETPMGAGRPRGYPVFNAPSELADAIAWTGWDACSTASNHAFDRGQDGIETTVRALGAAGVRHTGAFRSAADARRILILRVRGLRVAFLSYTYGLNQTPQMPNEWTVNILSRSRVVSDALRARRRGADFIVVNFHWGDEYVHEPSVRQRMLARYLLQRRIVDLIVGQHTHVVQPIRRVGGRFVVFGEGNLLSGQTFPPPARDGLVALIHVRAVGRRAVVTGVDYVPIYVRYPHYDVVPAGIRLLQLVRQGRGSSSEAQELLVSYRRTVASVGRSQWTRPVPALSDAIISKVQAEQRRLRPRDWSSLVAIAAGVILLLQIVRGLRRRRSAA